MRFHIPMSNNFLKVILINLILFRLFFTLVRMLSADINVCPVSTNFSVIVLAEIWSELIKFTSSGDKYQFLFWADQLSSEVTRVRWLLSIWVCHCAVFLSISVKCNLRLLICKCENLLAVKAMHYSFDHSSRAKISLRPDHIDTNLLITSFVCKVCFVDVVFWIISLYTCKMRLISIPRVNDCIEYNY